MYFKERYTIMEEFIAYIVKNLVDEPEAVQVRLAEGSQDFLITVRVSDSDIAKVVGRQGKIIKSLRTIAFTIGSRVGRRVRLEIEQ